MGRLAWHGPSAITSGSAVHGLWGASYRPSQIHFCRLAISSSGECTVENVQAALDRGDDRLRVAISERSGPPRRRTFCLITKLPSIHQRYDGATEWGVHRRRQIMTVANSEVEEAANLGDS